MREPPSYETQELREFAEALRGRRTVDQFLQTPVPDELVREAIEVATWAPNHFVTEPWRFILPGGETVGRIIDLCAGMVAADKGDAATIPAHRSMMRPTVSPPGRMNRHGSVTK